MMAVKPDIEFYVPVLITGSTEATLFKIGEDG